MMFVLALEAPNGALTAFTSPVPWVEGSVVPTLNGRILTQGFSFGMPWRVVFDEPPQYDDVVGFFLTPAAL